MPPPGGPNRMNVAAVASSRFRKTADSVMFEGMVPPVTSQREGLLAAPSAMLVYETNSGQGKPLDGPRTRCSAF